jgi:hypothetical protein
MHGDAEGAMESRCGEAGLAAPAGDRTLRQRIPSPMELFLRHVAEGSPFPWNLQAAAAGVQLAELSLQSRQERKWIDVPHVEA